jgi:hypothetical protein
MMLHWIAIYPSKKRMTTMTTDTKIKQQIYQLIESLPAERLPKLLNFLKYLLQPDKSGSTTSVAPIYQVHHYAADTGIPDLAAQHDHYLYGVNKREGLFDY